MTPSLLRWVTLYLLIGLAALLLAANLFAGNSAASSSVTTATATANTLATKTANANAIATVTAAVKSSRNVDETSPFKFSITVSSQSTSDEVKAMIQTKGKGDPKLQGRHAAFIIAYIGGPDLGTAQQVAKTVESALGQLSTGTDNLIFSGVAYQSVAFTGQITDANGHTHSPIPDAVDLEVYPNK